jgi:hypothetical protein
VRLLHTLARTHPCFDDPNLVSHAGLVPVMALAQRAGLGPHLSVGGFHVQVVARDAFQYPFGRLDLGLGRLQDRVSVGAGPGGEGGAEVLVVGIFGGDHQALPFGQLVGEGAVLRSQVRDPLPDLRDLLPCGQGELVALSLGYRLRFDVPAAARGPGQVGSAGTAGPVAGVMGDLIRVGQRATAQQPVPAAALLPGPDQDPRPVILARAVRPGAGRDLLPGPRRERGELTTTRRVG